MLRDDTYALTMCWVAATFTCILRIRTILVLAWPVTRTAAKPARSFLVIIYTRNCRISASQGSYDWVKASASARGWRARPARILALPKEARVSRDPAGNPGRDGDRDPRHPADGRPPGFAGVPPAPRAAGYSRPSAWYPAGYQRTAYQPATNRFPLITESFPWDVAAPSPTGTGPFTRVADRHPRVRPSAPDDDGENRSAGYETGDWLPRYGRHRQVRGRAARAGRRPARLAGPGGRERTRRHGPGGTRYAPQWYSIISSDPPATAPRRGPVAAARGPAKPSRAAWSRPFRAAQPFLPRPGKHHPARDVRPGFWLSGRTQAAAILVTLTVLGIAAEMIVSANNAGRQPSSAASPRFVPATLAGMDFVPYAAASTRGITQSQGRVASSGTEVVAVGAETGQRVPRAQFFVSSNGGRSWRLGSVTAAGGGTPPPGHAARFAGSGRREADPERGRHRDANGRGNRQVQAHGDGPDRRCLAQRRRRPELDTGLGAAGARRTSRLLRRGRHRSRIPAGQAGGGGRRPGRRRVPVRQRDELDAGGGSDDSRRFHPRSDERRPRRRRARRPVRPDADHLPLAGRRQVAADPGVRQRQQRSSVGRGGDRSRRRARGRDEHRPAGQRPAADHGDRGRGRREEPQPVGDPRRGGTSACRQRRRGPGRHAGSGRQRQRLPRGLDIRRRRPHLAARYGPAPRRA